MRKVPQLICGVIPPHIHKEVAAHTDDEASGTARATIEHMHGLAMGRATTLLERFPAIRPAPVRARKRRQVFDAQHRSRLPGRLVRNEQNRFIEDVEVNEAWDGSGATYDFFSQVFGRSSIDGQGMSLDSTVHYGSSFANALWNGRQMVYGHADGRIFTRFTASLDVIGHEWTHGFTQKAAALGYHGQTGAVNEHLADAFGMMVKQYTLGQSASESDWCIGAELLGPGVNGMGVRSMAFPGTAYDDPLIGKDPQPSHMRDYVETTDDNGGVHINSGILNHAFYIQAMTLGGKTHEVLGQIYYAVVIERLKPESDFAHFAQATVDVAGEHYGHGGCVQRIIINGWRDVGLFPRLRGSRRRRASAALPLNTNSKERKKAS